MPEPLDAALAELRPLLLDPELIRAVAAGRRRAQAPRVVRAELRPVSLRGGPRLQIVTSDGARPYTRNVVPGAEAAAAVDALLAEPFGNWHVWTVGRELQLRVTKKGQAQVHRVGATAATRRGGTTATGTTATGTTAIGTTATGTTATGTTAAESIGSGTTAATDSAAGGTAGVCVAVDRSVAVPLPHDRVKEHLIDPGDPLFTTIGGSAAKRRQVDAFLRALATAMPQPPATLRVVDLGCGNAYLTFAAYRYLTSRGVAVDVVGVDVREDQRQRNTELAEHLGVAGQVRFVAGTVLESVPFRDATADTRQASGRGGPVPEPDEPAPDLVLALHACDTATDEALARAVRWRARWVLAAPCCHHDIAAQIRQRAAPPAYEVLTRYGILRERFAETLTDALRASLLRLHGYKVDVVEFIDSSHTPRNVLLRARYTGAVPTADQRQEYARLVRDWQLTPALQRLLGWQP